MKDLRIGDMIGHMFCAELSNKDHPATIIASMDGLLALLPFSEIKLELKRAPEAVFKVYQMCAKHAMETFMFNLNGIEHNSYIKHPATALMTKKLRDFYNKNAQMRAFLNGCDKKDERSFMQAMKGTEFEVADRVIKRNTWDRSFFVVAEGQLIQFSQDGENLVLEEGAIIGVEQFLFNKQWDVDIICG